MAGRGEYYEIGFLGFPETDFFQPDDNEKSQENEEHQNHSGNEFYEADDHNQIIMEKDKK